MAQYRKDNTEGRTDAELEEMNAVYESFFYHLRGQAVDDAGRIGEAEEEAIRVQTAEYMAERYATPRVEVDAFNAGHAAFVAGKPRTENPYWKMIRSVHTQWHAGWDKAAESA